MEGVMRWTGIAATFLAAVAIPSAGRAQAARSPGEPAVRLQPADASASSDANEDATQLAKKLQNPIGDLYSFPFQGNTNFSYGPNKGPQEILNAQPVTPPHAHPRIPPHVAPRLEHPPPHHPAADLAALAAADP